VISCFQNFAFKCNLPHYTSNPESLLDVALQIGLTIQTTIFAQIVKTMSTFIMAGLRTLHSFDPTHSAETRLVFQPITCNPSSENPVSEFAFLQMQRAPLHLGSDHDHP
jgi:hypothetical protein